MVERGVAAWVLEVDARPGLEKGNCITEWPAFKGSWGRIQSAAPTSAAGRRAYGRGSPFDSAKSPTLSE